MDVEAAYAEARAVTIATNARIGSEITNLARRLEAVEMECAPFPSARYCFICGKEISEEILCRECASRLKNMLYPTSIDINELI